MVLSILTVLCTCHQHLSLGLSHHLQQKLYPFTQYVIWFQPLGTTILHAMSITVAVENPSHKGKRRIFVFCGWLIYLFFYHSVLKVYLGCVRISFLFLWGCCSILHRTDFAYLFICWWVLGCFSSWLFWQSCCECWLTWISRVTTFSLCICKQDF